MDHRELDVSYQNRDNLSTSSRSADISTSKWPLKQQMVISFYTGNEVHRHWHDMMFGTRDEYKH
jgi:hypothetical protein